MARYSPFAPVRPKALRQQARAFVMASYSPLLKQINAEYARQANAGGQAINTGTNALVNQYQAYQPQVANIYGKAQSDLASMNAATTAQLQGGAQSLQANLAQQLSAAGLPTTQAANVGQIGAGAAGASAGLGSAALGELVRRGAEAQNYAAQLPGIARSGGLYKLSDLRQQVESGRQKDVSALRSKIPGTLAQIEQELSNREFQKAVAAQTYGTTVAGLKLKGQQLSETARGHTLTYKAHMASVRATAARSGRTYSEGLSRSARHAVDAFGRPIINPATGAPYKYVPAPKSSSSKTPTLNYDPGLSKQFHYLVNKAGKPILRNGKRIPYQGSKSGGGGIPGPGTIH